MLGLVYHHLGDEDQIESFAARSEILPVSGGHRSLSENDEILNGIR